MFYGNSFSVISLLIYKAIKLAGLTGEYISKKEVFVRKHFLRRLCLENYVLYSIFLKVVFLRRLQKCSLTRSNLHVCV